LQRQGEASYVNSRDETPKVKEVAELSKAYVEYQIDNNVIFRVDSRSKYGFFHNKTTRDLFLCPPVMTKFISEEIKEKLGVSIFRQMLKNLEKSDEPPPSLHHISIFVTEKCNLSCLHCATSAKTNGREINIPLNKLLLVIEQAIPLGLRTVGISGGEPLTWRPLPELIEALSCREMSVHIDTNGTLLNRDIAARFADLNVHVALSLDSHLESLHDHLRGVPGVFKKLREAIDLLNDFNIHYKLNTCVYKENYPYLQQFFQWCHQIGIKRIDLNPIVPWGRGSKMYEKDQLLDTKELLSLVNLIRTTSNIPIILSLPPCLFSLDFIYHHFNRGFCDLKGRLSIEPDGHISVCGPAYLECRVSLGSLLEGLNLAELWTNHPFLLNIRQDTSIGICGNCIFSKSCAGFCKVLAYGVTHSWVAPYPFCQQLYKTQRFPEIYIRGD
jgi:radical SAM protein with 4Fe4S-binding SPASM domain